MEKCLLVGLGISNKSAYNVLIKRGYDVDVLVDYVYRNEGYNYVVVLGDDALGLTCPRIGYGGSSKPADKATIPPLILFRDRDMVLVTKLITPLLRAWGYVGDGVYGGILGHLEDYTLVNLADATC